MDPLIVNDGPYRDLELISKRHAVTGMLFSVVFFFTINRILEWVGPPGKVKTNEVWKWKNIQISWIHALIVGTWNLSCFYFYHRNMNRDLLGYHNYYIFYMVAFSTGYFLYDALDIMLSGKSRSMAEVLVHHVAVGSNFFYNTITSRFISYTCVALLAEVNSFFLHSRKLLQLNGWAFSSPMYRLNAFLNLVTFVPARFMACAHIFWGMYMFKYRVVAFYYYTLGSSMAAMTLINFGLFYRLLRTDFLRHKKTRAPAVEHSQNGGLSAAGNGHHHVGKNGFVKNAFPLENNNELKQRQFTD